MKKYPFFSGKTLPSSSAGYTLLEQLIIVAIIGALTVSAAPGWSRFINRQRLNAAQSQVYQAMQSAKSNAMRDKITWQASFQEITINRKLIVQWAVHPASITPGKGHWQNLESGIRLDLETTLPQTKGIRRIRFNYFGCPVYQVYDQCTQTSIRTQGRITLSHNKDGKTKRCVIVSTLLGAIRTAKENRKKDREGRYCY